MEHKSLLKPGRAGSMGSHSLQKDQKVLNLYRLTTQVEQSKTENHQKQDSQEMEGKCFGVMMQCQRKVICGGWW